MASLPPSPSTSPSSGSSSPPPTPSTSSPPSNSSSSSNSPPPTSQANGTSDPPAPATPSTPSAPPPQSPPTVPSAPAPASPSPPDPSPPPPAATPPLVPPLPPLPPLSPSSPPPPSVPGAPPPAVPTPPPPVLPSPPPASPSPPASSPPPPSPTAVSPSPPPPVLSPPLLPNNSPPPPPIATPPENSPPPPPSSKTPENAPPPPPTVTPPVPSGPQPASPPSPIPPRRSPPPPMNLRPPPPTNRRLPSPPPPPPSIPSSPDPPPPPINSSSGGTPPSISGVPSPGVPSGDPSGRSSNSSPAVPGNSNSSGGGPGISGGAAVAIGVVAGLIVLSLIGVFVWCLRKRKTKVARYNGGYIMPSPFASSPKSDSSFVKAHSSAPLVGSSSGSDFILSPSEPGGLGNSRSWFTYEELVKVTNGFSADNLLGEGGFGPVYKGCLSDGREVAVKQLKIGSSQGEREFRAEVEIISRVHHRHLVSLVGYCISENQRLLVYDYLPNNTVYFHLHGEDRPVMDWATRFKVAAGAARGIAYLHEDCHPRIIHRDIKSSNILLDYNFEARVADFGLARLAQDACTHVSTRVMGTFGYMAPEYASSGKLTEKSDVYSFGVVLLELITGRKPVDASQPLGDESLVEWARPLLSQALDNGFEGFDGLVDPRLEKNYVEVEMFRMIEVAAACVRHLAVKRPRMGLVVRALDSIGDSSDLSNGMRPGQSEVFDSAQQSAEIRMFQRMAFGSQDYSYTSLSRDHSRPWE